MKSLLSIFASLLLAVSLQAEIIHVPADQPTIQAGINAAVDGDTVLVADGTYTENINYLAKAITLASHYLMDSDTAHIANTIIDGSQPSNPDSGSVVYFISGEDTTSVLTGFTITGGSGTISEYTLQGQTFPTRAGGGILCHLSGARISHNHIHNNHIPQYTGAAGGGIAGFPLNNTAYIIIEDNRITNNSVTGIDESFASGALLSSNGRIVNNDISHNASSGSAFVWGAIAGWADVPQPRSFLIKNNRITHNTAAGVNVNGAGLTLEQTVNALVIGNSISDNQIVSASNASQGGGILITNTSDTILIDANTISRNVLQNSNSYGGGISLWSNNSSLNRDIRISNNIISGNEAGYGGGIRCRQSAATLNNNTIVNNTALANGGGIRVDTAPSIAMIFNTILWGNSAPSSPQIFLASGSLTVVYSDVEGGWVGDGNIDADPLLVADSLSNASPCIGAGTLQYDFGGGVVLHSPPYDINGRMRPYPAGSNPDMGAWESQEGIVGIEPEPGVDIPKTYTLHQNYPNPFNPATNIGFQIADFVFVTLTIYNVAGEKVATLVSENLSAGSYEYQWDGRGLASGVYLYRLEAGEFSQTKKLLLLK
jgi:hypothetical protein